MSADYSESSDWQCEDEEVVNSEEEEQKRSSREAFLKITVHLLRTMRQKDLADTLHNSKRFNRFNIMEIEKRGTQVT